MRNFLDKWQRYGWFSQKELGPFFIGVIGLGLIESWDLWGKETFSLSSGLQNWLYFSILCAIVMFVHHAAQRAMALSLGFKIEHRLWWNGLMFGLLAALLSQGKVAFLAVTTTYETLMPIHRLGSFRYGANMATLAKIAMAGPIANMVFAGVLGGLGAAGFLPATVATDLFWVSAFFALWYVAPIPPLDGAKIFYWSRYVYYWIVFSLIVYGLVARYFGAFGIAYPLAVALGLGVTYLFVEIVAKEWS